MKGKFAIIAAHAQTHAQGKTDIMMRVLEEQMLNKNIAADIITLDDLALRESKKMEQTVFEFRNYWNHAILSEDIRRRKKPHNNQKYQESPKIKKQKRTISRHSRKNNRS